jgi:hypothetical protein
MVSRTRNRAHSRSAKFAFHHPVPANQAYFSHARYGFEALPRRLLWRPRRTRQIPVRVTKQNISELLRNKKVVIKLKLLTLFFQYLSFLHLLLCK